MVVIAAPALLPRLRSFANTAKKRGTRSEAAIQRRAEIGELKKCREEALQRGDLDTVELIDNQIDHIKGQAVIQNTAAAKSRCRLRSRSPSVRGRSISPGSLGCAGGLLMG